MAGASDRFFASRPVQIVSLIGVLVLCVGGLAIAGARSPSGAKRGEASSNSTAVQDVVADKDSYGSGCEFGAAVSSAASGKTKSTDHCKAHGPKEGKATGLSKCINGKAKGHTKPHKGNGHAYGHGKKEPCTGAQAAGRNNGKAKGPKEPKGPKGQGNNGRRSQQGAGNDQESEIEEEPEPEPSETPEEEPEPEPTEIEETDEVEVDPSSSPASN